LRRVSSERVWRRCAPAPRRLLPPLARARDFSGPLKLTHSSNESASWRMCARICVCASQHQFGSSASWSNKRDPCFWRERRSGKVSRGGGLVAEKSTAGPKVHAPDEGSLTRVGIIAFVGFVIGVAWPRLAGISLVP